MDDIKSFIAFIVLIVYLVCSIVYTICTPIIVPVIGLFETIHYEPYDIPGKFLEKMGYSISYWSKHPLLCTLLWYPISFIPVFIIYVIAFILQISIYKQKEDSCIKDNHVLRQIQLNESIRTTDYPLFNPYSENLRDILRNTVKTTDSSQTKQQNRNTALAIEQLSKVEDAKGNTVLIVAAESGHHVLLNQFLERFEYIQSLQKSSQVFKIIPGVDSSPEDKNFMQLMKNENFLSDMLNKQNKDGKTALEVAREKGHTAIANKLEKITNITDNPASNSDALSSTTLAGTSDTMPPVVPVHHVSEEHIKKDASDPSL